MDAQTNDLQLPGSMRNIKLVKDMLRLIGSNDIPAAVNSMAEDVDWQSPVTNSTGGPVSWGRPRHGRGEVMSFFDELFSKIRAFDLKPASFVAGEDKVIVEGSTQGVVESTGRGYTTNWLMVIAVKNGKISSFRQYFDTADMVKAFAKAETQKAV